MVIKNAMDMIKCELVSDSILRSIFVRSICIAAQELYFAAIAKVSRSHLLRFQKYVKKLSQNAMNRERVRTINLQPQSIAHDCLLFSVGIPQSQCCHISQPFFTT